MTDRHSLSGIRSFRGDALVSMAVRSVGLALGFGVHILLSRTLGVDAYGRYAIVLGWALIFVIPTRLGLDTAALKFATHYRADGDHGRLAAFQRFSIAVMAIGSACWAGLGIAAAYGSTARQGQAMPWVEALSFAGMILPLALIGYYSAMLRAAGRIVPSQFYEQVLRPALLVAGILAMSAVVGMVSLDAALVITVLSLWLALVAVIAHSATAMPITGGQVGRMERGIWLRTGGTLLAISATQELMNQVDIVLLGWAGQPESAAIFSAAWRLASLVTFGLVAVSIVAASPIALAHQQGDQAGLARIARQAAWLATLFAVVAALAVNIAGPVLLGLFGSEFKAGSTALAVLSAGCVVNAMTGVVGYLLTMTGHEKDFLAILLLSLVLNVVANLLLVPILGATGAAIAAACALSVMNVMTAIRVRARLGVDGTILSRKVV